MASLRASLLSDPGNCVALIWDTRSDKFGVGNCKCQSGKISSPTSSNY